MLRSLRMTITCFAARGSDMRASLAPVARRAAELLLERLRERGDAVVADLERGVGDGGAALEEVQRVEQADAAPPLADGQAGLGEEAALERAERGAGLARELRDR